VLLQPLWEGGVMKSASLARNSGRNHFFWLALMILGIVGGRQFAGGAEAPAKAPIAVSTGAGTLVIVGGGSLPDSIRDRFLLLAGGKKARLVVIPTASGRSDRLARSLQFWKAQPVSSVVVLDAANRNEANTAAFVKPLTEATAVWLAGGDQSRLADIYRGTAVERELQKLLARGGVIGGTSAGASAMSGVMILGGNPHAKVGVGFGFLPDVVIDQHFQNRKRLERLLFVLSTHPDCLGLGIDEQTAIEVHGQSATVLGNANVRMCLCSVGLKSPRVQVLKAGQVIDLGRMVPSRVKPAAAHKEETRPAPAERAVAHEKPGERKEAARPDRASSMR
jgi:cyanophycinase